MNQATCDRLCELFGFEYALCDTNRLVPGSRRMHLLDDVFYFAGDFEGGYRFLASKRIREVYAFLRSQLHGTVKGWKYHTYDDFGNASNAMYTVSGYFDGKWHLGGSFDSYVEAYKAAQQARKEHRIRVRIMRGTEVTFTPRPRYA